MEGLERMIGNLYKDGMTPEKFGQETLRKRQMREMFKKFAIFAIGMIGVLLLWSIYDIISWKCGKKKHQHKKKGYAKGHGFTPEMREAIEADPELRDMIEDLETNGSKALQKYLDNLEMMEKVEELKRKFGITSGPPIGAAADSNASKDSKDEKDAKGSEDTKGSKASKDSKKSKDSEESKKSKESESEAGKPKKRAAAAAGREAGAEAKGSAKEAS